MSWRDLASVWLDELSSDDTYESVVTPLLIEILQPRPGKTYLDLGSGEGRVMRALEDRGNQVIGIEANEELARLSGSGSVVAELPNIPARIASVDGLYAVLVLEHIADHRRFFAEAASVARPGGVLAVVMNHPVWTAPGSTPITDSDGEVLWRPGDYFSSGHSEARLSGQEIVFHHRQVASLLNGAAQARWALEHMIEKPHHELQNQSGIPRLLACRWALT